ncbi:MAG TPA: TrkA family potassium uptake protein [Thermoanaerobaculia bacterium]|jgi:trk system potassium uptake protein TrkA
MKRFVIVGLGNFGASAAETLSGLGHDVAALDVREEAVDRIAGRVAQAAVGSGMEQAVLERIGAGSADAAIVSTGDDITASVLTTLALRDCGVREIYVKVISGDHARVMEKLGARETIFPERESAQRLAKRIAYAQIVNFIELGPGFSLQEMAVPQAWAGRSLRELELPRRYRVAVIAVHDYLRGTYKAIPDPDAPLTDSDTLLVAGEDEHLERLNKLG